MLGARPPSANWEGSYIPFAAMAVANSRFRHSPGVNSLTEQSLISSRFPPRCFASIVITSCFNFFVPQTLFLSCLICFSQSFLIKSHSWRILRPSLSIDVIAPDASDLTALASLSIRAPSFCLSFIWFICVSISFSCAAHSVFVVSSRCSVCVFSACNSPTICSNLSRNRGQFGFWETVQKNFASSFPFGIPCSWTGKAGVLASKPVPLATRAPWSVTKESSLAARSKAVCDSQALGGASSSR
mmetsp:Transcript_54150/g.144240  ORF Transcript_54150/g.144240 Transcript_54150/m.144240 type:complete len:243 (-) Transcript_54150:1168-1896(-)